MQTLNDLKALRAEQQRAMERKHSGYQDRLNQLIAQARRDGVILEIVHSKDYTAPAMGSYTVIGLARADRPTYQSFMALDKLIADREAEDGAGTAG